MYLRTLLFPLTVVTAFNIKRENATAVAAEDEEDTVEDSSSTLSSLMYTGPIVPGGPNLNLTGTPESIYDQILELNPFFNSSDFGLPEYSDTEDNQETENGTGNYTTTTINRVKVPASKAHRASCNGSHPIDPKKPYPGTPQFGYPTQYCPFDPWRGVISCRNNAKPHQKTGKTADRWIPEQIRYLKRLPGLCGAEPYHYTRVSCEWKNAAWLLNNEAKRITIPCYDIGDAVQLIYNKCHQLSGGIVNLEGNMTLALKNSKLEHFRDFTVVVGGDKCKKPKKNE